MIWWFLKIFYLTIYWKVNLEMSETDQMSTEFHEECLKQVYALNDWLYAPLSDMNDCL